jgi:hypothetical protein
MRGHSRSKNGFRSPVPGHLPLSLSGSEDVDARHEAGHDDFLHRLLQWQSQSWPAGLKRRAVPGGSRDATAERCGQLCVVRTSAGHDKEKSFPAIGRHAG